MDKVRIGLIGLGFMGSTHFRIYEAMKDAQIVALADVDPAKRRGDISKVVGNIGNADNSRPLNMEGIRTYESGFDLMGRIAADIRRRGAMAVVASHDSDVLRCMADEIVRMKDGRVIECETVRKAGPAGTDAAPAPRSPVRRHAREVPAL